MPMRYLKTADVPAMLKDLSTQPPRGPMPTFQTGAWQDKWVVETDTPFVEAAVLSYRWRTPGKAECLSDYLGWVGDMQKTGYQTCHSQLKPLSSDWSVVDKLKAVQIEVLVWMLWCHATKQVRRESCLSPGLQLPS